MSYLYVCYQTQGLSQRLIKTHRANFTCRHFSITKTITQYTQSNHRLHSIFWWVIVIFAVLKEVYFIATESLSVISNFAQSNNSVLFAVKSRWRTMYFIWRLRISCVIRGSSQRNWMWIFSRNHPDLLCLLRK